MYETSDASSKQETDTVPSLIQGWDSAIISQQMALALRGNHNQSEFILVNGNTIQVFDRRSNSLSVTSDFPCDAQSIEATMLGGVNPRIVVHFLSQDSYDSTMCMLNIVEAIKTIESVRYLAIIPESLASSIPATLQHDICRIYRNFYKMKLSIAIIPRIEVKLVHANESGNETDYTTGVHLDAISKIVEFLIKILEDDETKDVYNLTTTLTDYLDIVVKYKSVSKSISLQIYSLYYRKFHNFLQTLCPNLESTSCLDLLHTSQLLPDMNLMPSGNKDYIFTSYFTSKHDPQRSVTTEKNDFKYIGHWYSSIKAHNMKAVVFHDGLSAEFMQRIKQDYADIEFAYWDLAGRTTNDARFLAYLSYLDQHPEIERIQCTDISDVVFQQNPFHLMTLLGRHLYIGQDLEGVEHFQDNGWIQKVTESCGVHSFPDFYRVKQYQYLYNAGMIGGDRSIMMNLLHKLKDAFDNTPPVHNCNMAVVNYVVHKYFDDIVFTGFPFNNFFKHRGYDYMGVYSAHK